MSRQPRPERNPRPLGEFVRAVPAANPGSEPIQPIPSVEEVFDYLDVDLNEPLILLGRTLFHDPRVSHDDTISCASCHDLRYAGIDRAARATGVHGHLGPINTPTVFNTVFNVDQFWDGRADTLHDQAEGPPLNPFEMGSEWPEIQRKIRTDSRYVEAFRAAFPDRFRTADDITLEMFLEAISTFEMTLVTPESRFDQWLNGDTNAITADEFAGYQTFKDIGCVDCHYGVSIGGKTYQPIGRKQPYFREHDLHPVDLGRFNVTGDERDRHVFKVPGLRNVALTGPWFHDGSQRSLADAVRTMAWLQLGIRLTEVQERHIVAFLRTLSGRYEGRDLSAAFNRVR